jgi:hypothetical protein
MDANIKVAEVPASHGASWVAASWHLFAAAPVAWLGLCAGWMAITFALLIIPFIGGVIANFLQPVFFASFAIAISAVRRTRILMKISSPDSGATQGAVNLGAMLLMAEIVIFAGIALLGCRCSHPNPGAGVNLNQLADALAGKVDPHPPAPRSSSS